MNKHCQSQAITQLARAAFHVDAAALRGGSLDLLVEASLARVLAGTTPSDPPTTCSTYVCNTYMPT